MQFCVHYESGLKTAEKPLFFILTTVVAVVLYSINIIAIHVVWRHILGTGKVKSFPLLLKNHIDILLSFAIKMSI